MKLAITIYPDDFAEADRIIHQLRGVRSLELDSYMGKASYDKPFDKPKPSYEQGLQEIGLDPEKPLTFEDQGIERAERANVSPGEPSIGKIGSGTKEWIVGELTRGTKVPAHFGTKYSEHLKLLWKRGEVKYDGKEYYL